MSNTINVSRARLMMEWEQDTEFLRMLPEHWIDIIRYLLKDYRNGKSAVRYNLAQGNILSSIRVKWIKYKKQKP